MAVPVGVLLEDVPALLAFAETGVKAFSPKPASGAQWATALGFAQGGLGYTLLTTADLLKKGPITIDEVAGILGLSPGGLLSQAASLADTLESQLKAASTPPAKP
jgi:hypothetical protein